MGARTILRTGTIAVMGLLCLGHTEAGGCGGSSPSDHHVDGVPSGATCPSSGAPTAQAFGQAFLDSYCRSCHSEGVTGTARHGAPPDINLDTLQEVRSWADSIDVHAAVGPDSHNEAMPPADSPQPSHEERELLGEWLACGAP